MSLEKMKLVKVMGDLEELDNVIMTCCQNSHFQTEQAMQYVSGVKGFAPLNEENPYSPALQKLTEIAANSKLEFEKVDSSKLDIEDSKLSEYVNKIDGTLGSLQEQRNQLRNNINMYKQSISELEHFSGLDLNLKAIFDCKFIKVRFGRLPKASYEKLGKYDKNPYILFFPCSTDNVGYWGVYFTPIHAAQDVDRIFASLYFERLIIPDLSGTPDECLESLKKQIDSTEKEIDELTKQISKFWESETDRAQLVFSRLTKLSNMFDLRRNACKYGKGFYFIGWIPARYSGSLKKALGAIDGIDFEIKNPDSTDKTTPPVLLKNNRFFKPFEFFVEMYGLPSYGEIDPTKFVAVTYILLFGIMFGDFGQGLLLSLIGLIMWKWKKMALGPILVRCGFSSAFFGLIFGSVFGFEDALDGFLSCNRPFRQAVQRSRRFKYHDAPDHRHLHRRGACRHINVDKHILVYKKA